MNCETSSSSFSPPLLAAAGDAAGDAASAASIASARTSAPLAGKMFTSMVSKTGSLCSAVVVSAAFVEGGGPQSVRDTRSVSTAGSLCCSVVVVSAAFAAAGAIRRQFWIARARPRAPRGMRTN
jgi:hypothetical protein